MEDAQRLSGTGGRGAPQITPSTVLKAAYAAKLIADGDAWMDMLKHRNLMSHTYDFQKFKEAVTAIHTRYLAALGQVYTLLKKELLPS